MVSTSLMVDTIPVLSRRNILCAVNCALTEDPTWVYGHRHSRFNGLPITAASSFPQLHRCGPRPSPLHRELLNSIGAISH